VFTLGKRTEKILFDLGLYDVYNAALTEMEQCIDYLTLFEPDQAISD
jgi:hypothetical protein